jgi:cell division protein FtsB
MKNNEYVISEIQDKIRAVRRHIRNIIMVSGVFLFFLQSYMLTDIYAETVQLTIIHSNNINGRLFPCPT